LRSKIRKENASSQVTAEAETNLKLWGQHFGRQPDTMLNKSIQHSYRNRLKRNDRSRGTQNKHRKKQKSPLKRMAKNPCQPPATARSADCQNSLTESGTQRLKRNANKCAQIKTTAIRGEMI
jgi:hypothetical protein